MRDLFDFPPAQLHSPTSIEAAEAVEPKCATLRRAVLAAIRESGESGLTDEEVQDILAMPGSTERPRRVELVTAQLVRDSGRTRKTRSGRNAVVWVA